MAKVFYAIVYTAPETVKEIGPFASIEEANEGAKASGLELLEIESSFDNRSKEEKTLDAETLALVIVKRFARTFFDGRDSNLSSTAEVSAENIAPLSIALKEKGFRYTVDGENEGSYSLPFYVKDGYEITIGYETEDKKAFELVLSPELY